jgi:hypothetical protein
MGTSTNELTNIRLGALVHALADGRYQTRCGIDSRWTFGETAETIDCMTCLVDRPSAAVREAEEMGTRMGVAFAAELARVFK